MYVYVYTHTHKCTQVCRCVYTIVLCFGWEKEKRYALDGKLYMINEFQDYYGKAAAESIWKSAPHFINLQEFCRFFSLWVEQTCLKSDPELVAESSAIFGLWLPSCILLVDIHHLEGKLKGSRLAPEVWHPDIWEDAFQIGLTGNSMMVLDLCTQLLGSEDPLAKLGRVEMKIMLKEFSNIMDGALFEPERLTKNLLIRFFLVCGCFIHRFAMTHKWLIISYYFLQNNSTPSTFVYIHIYTYMYICMCMFIYIYIYMDIV